MFSLTFIHKMPFGSNHAGYQNLLKLVEEAKEDPSNNKKL